MEIFSPVMHLPLVQKADGCCESVHVEWHELPPGAFTVNLISISSKRMIRYLLKWRTITVLKLGGTAYTTSLRFNRRDFFYEKINHRLVYLTEPLLLGFGATAKRGYASRL